MSKVVIDFNDLSFADKIQKASNIVAAMDGNEHFPTPVPTLDQMRKIIQDMETAYQESLGGGKKWLGFRDLANADLLTAINGLGGYVQAASSGDKAIILSSGFSARANKTSPKHVDVPGVPVVKQGRLSGQVKVRWAGVKGARNYSLRISHDNGETWEDAGTHTRSSVEIEGLEVGTHPMFQVAAFGPLGLSNWTESGTGSVT